MEKNTSKILKLQRLHGFWATAAYAGGKFLETLKKTFYERLEEFKVHHCFRVPLDAEYIVLFDGFGDAVRADSGDPKPLANFF